MSRYDTIDLLLTDDGDFILDEQGNLTTAEGDALIHQVIATTLKSSNPEWFQETFPADLEDLIGRENSEETGELGKTKIMEGLRKTGFFNEDDLWVEARPSGTMGILFFVFVNSPFSTEPLIYEVELDLGFGTSVRRVR